MKQIIHRQQKSAGIVQFWTWKETLTCVTDMHCLIKHRLCSSSTRIRMGEVAIHEPKDDKKVAYSLYSFIVYIVFIVYMQLGKYFFLKCTVSSNKMCSKAHPEGWFSQEQAQNYFVKESLSLSMFYHHLNISSFLWVLLRLFSAIFSRKS